MIINKFKKRKRILTIVTPIILIICITLSIVSYAAFVTIEKRHLKHTKHWIQKFKQIKTNTDLEKDLKEILVAELSLSPETIFFIRLSKLAILWVLLSLALFTLIYTKDIKKLILYIENRC